MGSKSIIKIYKKQVIAPTTIHLPSSKSESNRALIINSFAKGKLSNLSDARDTQTMISLLQSEDRELNVLDAGTTMRFLVAYFALTNQNKKLTGTPRMCERPIKPLTELIFIIHPFFCFKKVVMQARVILNTPPRFVSITSLQSS